ncbi:MAG: hypothetical protein ACD_62C00257G0005 [uncultured bacterium]|nr:MAG: hypothetical protein ACD_62C00257G0005 [uncultured bacterium]HLD45712.1 hypothetical protein [bacterium]
MNFITAKEAFEKTKTLTNAVLLDVRTPKEFQPFFILCRGIKVKNLVRLIKVNT